MGRDCITIQQFGKSTKFGYHNARFPICPGNRTWPVLRFFDSDPVQGRGELLLPRKGQQYCKNMSLHLARCVIRCDFPLKTCGKQNLEIAFFDRKCKRSDREHFEIPTGDSWGQKQIYVKTLKNEIF